MNQVVSADALAQEAQRHVKTRHWDQALEGWERLKAFFPNDLRGYRGSSDALQQLGRHREADIVLERGMAVDPNDLAIASDHAWLATRLRAHVEALQRWEAVMNRHPEDAVSYIGFAVVLRSLKRMRLAETVLIAARTKFPLSTRIAVDLARIAEADDRLDEALDRWRDVMANFPNSTAGYVGAAEALRKLRRTDEALEIVEGVVERFPASYELAFQLAAIATQRGCWEEALEHWASIAQRFPDNPEVARQVAHGIGEVELGRRLRRLDDEQVAAAAITPMASPQATPDVAVEPTLELLDKFENIGFDCEFGLVQRQLRLEPLSLLRWAGSSLRGLIKAFEQDFDGLGDASRTSMEIRQGEYVYGSREYEMILHTFIREADADRDTLFKTLCQRMAFLRRKFLEDLSDARKILVYKASSELNDQLMERLFQATRRLGPNRLMVVKVEEVDVHDPCWLQPMHDGLAVGYRPLVPNRPDEWKLLQKSWISLCEMAQQHYGVANPTR